MCFLMWLCFGVVPAASGLVLYAQGMSSTSDIHVDTTVESKCFKHLQVFYTYLGIGTQAVCQAPIGANAVWSREEKSGQVTYN